MKIVELDGRWMHTVEEAHAYIAQVLDFPEYYGCNLDALWDELSTISEPVHVTISQVHSLLTNLGEYGQKLIDTFIEAAQSDVLLDVELVENEDAVSEQDDLLL